MKIETVWEYSIDTEAQRVLHNAYHIASGFFRINNFYVLPMDYKTSQAASVVRFPDLNYHLISRFWDKVKLLDVYSNLPYTLINSGKEYLLEEVKKLLIKENLRTFNFDRVRQTWEKASNELWEEMFSIMPDKRTALKRITIFPTVIGTTCSFSWSPGKDKEIYIYIRDDQDIYSITEAILTTLTRKEVYKDLDGSWSESELLVDWLVTKSSISKVLKKYQPKTNFIPTLKGTRVKQNAKLLKESENFYKKLGLPTGRKVFSLDGEYPIIYNKSPENLTPTERIILKLLIEKANNVASFDELGNILFKSEDNFSLYAISKQIERLRNKLEENGVSSSYIQTLRGQGYVLKN